MHAREVRRRRLRGEQGVRVRGGGARRRRRRLGAGRQAGGLRDVELRLRGLGEEAVLLRLRRLERPEAGGLLRVARYVRVDLRHRGLGLGDAVVAARLHQLRARLPRRNREHPLDRRVDPLLDARLHVDVVARALLRELLDVLLPPLGAQRRARRDRRLAHVVKPRVLVVARERRDEDAGHARLGVGHRLQLAREHELAARGASAARREAERRRRLDPAQRLRPERRVVPSARRLVLRDALLAPQAEELGARRRTVRARRLQGRRRRRLQRVRKRVDGGEEVGGVRHGWCGGASTEHARKRVE